MENTETKTTAAEVKGETKTKEQIQQERQAASTEKCKRVAIQVNEILKEHSCFMTAEMTITERGAFPKVIILDEEMLNAPES